MKKIILYIFAILIGFTSCDLDTNPTDKMGTADLPKTVDGCMAALNGVYRGFDITQYSTGYATENFGPA